MRRGLAAVALALAISAGGTGPAGARWDAPHSVVTPGWQPNGSLRTAMTSDGDVVAAWPEGNGSTYRTMLGVWPRSGAPASAELPSYVNGVLLATDGTGSAVAVYTISGDDTLYWRERPAGGAFGAAKSLDLTGHGSGQPVGIGATMNAGGDLALSWARGGVLYAAIRPAGGGFGQPQALAPAGSGGWQVTTPRLSDDGELLVAWTTEAIDGDPGALRALHRAPSGVVSVPQTLSAAGMSPTLGSLVIDAAGHAIIAWREHKGFSGPTPPPRMAVRDPGGDFRDAALPEGAAGISDPPAVAISGSGHVTLAHPSSRGLRVYSAQFGSELRRIHTYPSYGSSVVAAASPGGRVLLGWEVEANRWVTAQRDGSGTFGPTEDLTPDCAGASLPQLAVDDAGRTAASWGGVHGAPAFLLATGDGAAGHQGCAAAEAYSATDRDNPPPEGPPGGGSWAPYAGPNPNAGTPPPATLARLRLRRPRLTGTDPGRLITVSGSCGELCAVFGSASVVAPSGRVLHKETIRGGGFDDGKVRLKHRFDLPARVRAKLDGRRLEVVLRLRVGDRWNRRVARRWTLHGKRVER